jgi:hypothetical protein
MCEDENEQDDAGGEASMRGVGKEASMREEGVQGDSVEEQIVYREGVQWEGVQRNSVEGVLGMSMRVKKMGVERAWRGRRGACMRIMCKERARERHARGGACKGRGCKG